MAQRNRSVSVVDVPVDWLLHHPENVIQEVEHADVVHAAIHYDLAVCYAIGRIGQVCLCCPSYDGVGLICSNQAPTESSEWREPDEKFDDNTNAEILHHLQHAAKYFPKAQYELSLMYAGQAPDRFARLSVVRRVSPESRSDMTRAQQTANPELSTQLLRNAAASGFKAAMLQVL